MYWFLPLNQNVETPPRGKTMNVERRKFDRHPVSKNLFFVFNHDSTEMAEIKDISEGGLKFEYLPVEPQKAQWKLIDIFSKTSQRVYILGIPCKLIYNIITLSEDRTFNGSPARIGGLEFSRLEKNQKEKIYILLNMIQAKVQA
jgi:hypothetical protein